MVAKRINPPDQQQIIIKHAYEKMLLKTFSFGTQNRTLTNSNDNLFRFIPVSFRCHSGITPVHSGPFRCHSGSFRYIAVHSGPFRCHSGSFRSIPVSFRSIPVHSGVIPVHSGPFRSILVSFLFIPVHSGPFRCHSGSFRSIPPHSGSFRSVSVFSNALLSIERSFYLLNTRTICAIFLYN